MVGSELTVTTQERVTAGVMTDGSTEALSSHQKTK